MATVRSFEELRVWQDARELVSRMYSITKVRPFAADHDLRSQIRRAAMSTMSNIAEGFERGTRKEFIQFLYIAKGSNGEVRSQLWIAHDQCYLEENRFDELRTATVTLSRRLSSFIRYLERSEMKTRIRKTR